MLGCICHLSTTQQGGTKVSSGHTAPKEVIPLHMCLIQLGATSAVHLSAFALCRLSCCWDAPFPHPVSPDQRGLYMGPGGVSSGASTAMFGDTVASLDLTPDLTSRGNTRGCVHGHLYSHCWLSQGTPGPQSALPLPV